MKQRVKKGGMIAGICNVLAMLLALSIVAIPVQAQQTSTSEQKETSYGIFKGFIDNAKAGYQFRTSYFYRDSSGDDNFNGAFTQEAMGMGGWRLDSSCVRRECPPSATSSLCLVRAVAPVWAYDTGTFRGVAYDGAKKVTQSSSWR